MLLNITPSGNELQRKMLLSHSSDIRTIFLILLLLIPIAIFIGDYYSEGSGDDANQSYLRNVAMIMVNDGSGVSQGTAFLICKDNGDPSGYLLTARHVIDATTSKQVFLNFPKIEDETGASLTTTATIEWTTDVPFNGNDLQSLRYDVALLKLDDFSVLPADVTGFFIGSEVEIKDPIAIYGFPGGNEYANSGQISSDKFQGEEDLMLLGLQLDHGLSGAPVYSEAKGEVLGIAVAGENGTNIINLALKMSRIRDLLDQAGKLKLFQ